MAHFDFCPMTVRSLINVSSCWFVGCHYGGSDNQLPTFIDASIWTNGFIEYNCNADNPRVQLFAQRTSEMKAGDFIIAKRMNGRGASTMTIMAIGVVVGRKSASTMYVAWVMPNMQFETPLMEVGTLSACYSGKELPLLFPYLEMVRDKFLSENLTVLLKRY